ncbi:unnamed protein product [Rhodiola kirilowii]
MRGLATVSLLLLMASTLTVANANVFTIFWNSGVNYTDWASQKQFFVGDWLKFVFSKYQYSVMEVNQTNYDKCIETDFITNITRGGRDVFQVNETRPYYFISGFGQCWGGVKLAINVQSIPPPPPKPSPSQHKNASPSSVAVSGLLMFMALAFNVVMVNA